MCIKIEICCMFLFILVYLVWLNSGSKDAHVLSYVSQNYVQETGPFNNGDTTIHSTCTMKTHYDPSFPSVFYKLDNCFSCKGFQRRL